MAGTSGRSSLIWDGGSLVFLGAVRQLHCRGRSLFLYCGQGGAISMWNGVRQRFRRFHEDLLLTRDQIDDGLSKQLGVRQSLQRAYYDQSTDNPPGFVVGSWGKRTAVRPPRD